MITLFTDALSYMPCLFQHHSDHSPVVASVLLGRIYKLPKTHSRSDKPRDHRALSGPGSEEIREQYQASVARQLQQLRGDVAPKSGGVATFYTTLQKLYTQQQKTLCRWPQDV